MRTYGPTEWKKAATLTFKIYTVISKPVSGINNTA
jgi:hypothetical protein